MLSLYGKVYGISNSESYREICDTLQNGLTAPEYTAKELPEQTAIEQSVLASPQEIHQTFSMLLELLTLTPQHRKHLHEVRGLTDEQIERLGYKSTPPFYLCRSLAQKLRSRGCKVEGVPGFYVGKDDKWTVNFNSVTAGIIIPAKGIDGMIRGAQIRLDTPIRDQESDPDKSGTKYLWLSSASKKRGVSSGSPVHFVGDPFTRVVYVTEGLLKADVAHFLMDRSFAATAGANNVNKLDMLFALLAANGTEVIIEAEDMDKYHNAAVSKGASKIYLMARSHGLECRRLTWDPNYKGIDDWQLAMRKKKEQRDVSQINFRTRFVCGLCSFDAISEEIAAWHERNTGSSTLHDHLGLSEQEYAHFLRDGDAALEQYLLSLRAQQCFRIYQPDVSEGKAADFAFGGIRALQKAGYEQPPASEYALVYEGTLVCEVQQDDAIRLKLVAARYSRTCGRTGHHFKDGLAFKFEDELYQSVLRDIEWTPSRTGEIAPVAVLDSVVIDGCTVSRASLHNLSFIEGLELMPGCRVLVSKRNMIIPHIEENLERGHFDLDAVTPKHCPCCGAETRFHITDGGKKALFCDNPDCAMRKLRRFVHFASKKAMDIEGLSEATLERLIARGWLHSFTDVYRLDHYMQEIICMDGFGEKSWDNLWGAIQRSRNTTFERYLIAMDIPMIGNHASKVLAKQFGSSPSAFEEAVENDFDFSQLSDFGETLHQNIHQWFAQEENRILWEELQEMVTIQTVTTETHSMEDNPFVGCTLVVTGKVEPYTRSGINAKIESLGAVAGSSVTKKTDYLICGENAGSKLDKARALGIRVLSPGEFFQMIGE